jgi:aspartyl-tRNA(Asn)/glutamyl-tRNA(Gln) amidotransferase subunit B
MEEGSLRCEPNISIRPEGSEVFGTKTELKNLNSFRSVQLGVQYEVRRQAAAIERGERILQETRGWNEQNEASFAMRLKEQENDYRYFPDPDLVPMAFDDSYIEGLRASLPELPVAKSLRYQSSFGLSEYDANWLVTDLEVCAFFEEAVAIGGEPKAIVNWMTSDFAKLLNETGASIRQSKVTPVALVELTRLIADGTITGKTAKELFGQVFETGESPGALVRASGKTLVSDAGEIEALVREVIADNPDVVAKFLAGQANVKGYLVGQVMKKSQGRAKPDLVQSILEEVLS